MLCKSPVLHAAEDFISIAEIGAIVGRADDAAWLASHGVTTRHNFTGWPRNVHVDGSDEATALHESLPDADGLHPSERLGPR